MTKEEIETFNAIKDLPIIKQYIDLLDKVCSFNANKPKERFYKSSKKYDYFIELPYEDLTLDSQFNYYIRKRGYSYNGKNKKTGSVRYFCLSLCNYTLKEIKEKIDESIKEDNLEILEEMK